MKVCIVGGGGSVAVATRILTAKRSDVEIEVFTKRDVAGYRPCELTYVLGKQIPDFATMINFDNKAMQAKKVNYHFENTVTEIDRAAQTITTTDGSFNYDKLILATGASPILPPIPGIEGQGIYVLGTDMKYAKELQKVIAKSKSCLIIGAGAIGLEVAEALVKQDYQQVIVVDAADRPLVRSFDSKMSKIVSESLEQLKIETLMSEQVIKIEDNQAKKLVTLKDSQVEVDFVLVATGFRPNNELAQACGLEIGPTGGVKVNKQMLTSDPNIYAIGDVIEGWDVVGQKPTLTMKADNAVRTGKVAGRHLAGDGEVEYSGTVGGFIIHLAGKFFGGVGYTEAMARAHFGEQVKSVWHEAMTLPKYLGGKPIKIKLIYHGQDKILLGAQMASEANFAAELDKLGLAISEKISLDKLSNAEVVYTPASGWPYGPVAQAVDKCL